MVAGIVGVTGIIGAALPAAAGWLGVAIAGGVGENAPAGGVAAGWAGIATCVGVLVAGGVVVLDAVGVLLPGDTGVAAAGGPACVVGVTLGEHPVPKPTKQITLTPVMRVLTRCHP